MTVRKLHIHNDKANVKPTISRIQHSDFLLYKYH